MINVITIILILILCYFVLFNNISENFQIKEPKIIILIISSGNFDQYKDMHAIWEKYMNTHKNITAFFIENNDSLNQEVVVDKDKNTIYCKGSESYVPGILNKTIKSINHCLQNFDFDYIYRTNLSSVLNLNKLYSYLQNNTVDYAGQHMETFISGSGIILSKEACKKLIQDKSLINNMEPDDVAIGKTLSKIYEMINIEFYALSSIDDKIFTDNNYNNVNPITFQFRCRFSNEHTHTPQAMAKMYQKIYNY